MYIGTRPPSDVLSSKARRSTASLRKDHRAALVDVPARPGRLFGDAVHSSVSPEPVPCFYQWLPSMPSPLTDPTPVSERNIVLYFVGGGSKDTRGVGVFLVGMIHEL